MAPHGSYRPEKYVRGLEPKKSGCCTIVLSYDSLQKCQWPEYFHIFVIVLLVKCVKKNLATGFEFATP